MDIDITSFNKLNVIDTCAIDNLLSSITLYTASINANCKFCYTKFVEYEMFYKQRKESSNQSIKLQSLLRKETKLNRIECHDLSIDDLQDIEIMEKRKMLGKGELSSIAFARKINQSFMTDDQGARKLASIILGKLKVQTTPHLLGWLLYKRELIDTDFGTVIQEHEANNRTLSRFFKDVYEESSRIRILERR